MANSLLILAAETTAHESEGANPYVVGAVALGLLIAMLLAVVAFGGGREHS